VEVHFIEYKDIVQHYSVDTKWEILDLNCKYTEDFINAPVIHFNVHLNPSEVKKLFLKVKFTVTRPQRFATSFGFNFFNSVFDMKDSYRPAYINQSESIIPFGNRPLSGGPYFSDEKSKLSFGGTTGGFNFSTRGISGTTGGFNFGTQPSSITGFSNQPSLNSTGGTTTGNTYGQPSTSIFSSNTTQPPSNATGFSFGSMTTPANNTTQPPSNATGFSFGSMTTPANNTTSNQPSTNASGGFTSKATSFPFGNSAFSPATTNPSVDSQVQQSTPTTFSQTQPPTEK